MFAKKQFVIVRMMMLIEHPGAGGCGGQVQQAVEEAAPTAAAAVEAAVEEVAPTVQAAIEEVAPTVEAAIEEVAPTVEAAIEEVAGEEEMADESMDGDSYLARAMAGEFAGEEVLVLGVMVDEEAVKMEEAVKPFVEATGIDVIYTGTKEFETQINVRVDAGNPPDIANISQPGMLKSFVAAGHVVDVNDFLTTSNCKKTTTTVGWTWPPWTSPDGAIMSGVWHRASAKSMVWYPKARFEKRATKCPKHGTKWWR